MVSPEWFGATEASASAEGMIAISMDTRDGAVDQVIEGYETLMQRLSESHAPEFLEIDVTMPQAKLLYLLGAAGELHMSDLVVRLGVSLSTISGLVDRVVDHGLATRREDPADRRQVLVGLTPGGTAFIDRFRELNARQMRELLERLDDAELELVRAALVALSRAAAVVPPRASNPASAAIAADHGPRTVTGKDPA
jgi:DNA-binding MarR family transcriptional regulator